MAITNGTYRSKASGNCVLGASKNKGTPFLEFYLKIIGGDNAGGSARATLYFTENTNERSIQSLQIMGWKGDDLSEFADGELHGIDANEVDAVIELESYKTPEGEERTSPRVQWINRAGGFLNTDAAMTAEAAQTFGEKMRGLVLAVKAKSPKSDSNANGTNNPRVHPEPEKTSDDMPF